MYAKEELLSCTEIRLEEFVLLFLLNVRIRGRRSLAQTLGLAAFPQAALHSLGASRLFIISIASVSLVGAGLVLTWNNR